MEARKEAPLILETARPDEASAGPGDSRLNICVVFTSAEYTLAALRKASALADNLGARITLMAIEEVPFPLPLDDPPVALGWSQERLRAFAGQIPVETIVRFFLCRDRTETLKGALGPRSMVVIGHARNPWPFTAEKRLGRELRRAGHEVIYAETE